MIFTHFSGCFPQKSKCFTWNKGFPHTITRKKTDKHTFYTSSRPLHTVEITIFKQKISAGETGMMCYKCLNVRLNAAQRAIMFVSAQKGQKSMLMFHVKHWFLKIISIISSNYSIKIVKRQIWMPYNTNFLFFSRFIPFLIQFLLPLG